MEMAPTTTPDRPQLMTQPTYDDANLILRLYELRREERLRQARAWFTAHFKPKSWDDLARIAPAGSDENASYRMVITYWDMAASFVTSGVLDQQLFFQSGREMLLVWERVRDVLPAIREKYEDPNLWMHLEQVGSEYAAWYSRQSPGAYPAFLKRIKG
jgi:hypothetical protein